MRLPYGGSPLLWGPRLHWHERRGIYPEGVASGDPESDSVLLWTRRPPIEGNVVEKLTVEIAEDESFRRVIATADAPISEASDWTCRVLVGGLKPAKVYWYRFTDPHGSGSRVGRTITAPTDDDTRTVRFAFISCQNANQGAQNAYRRMIFEDEHAAEEDRLGFVSALRGLYLRNRLVPRGSPARYVRPTSARHRSLRTRRKDRGLFTFPRTSATIAPSTAATFMIPTCRTRAPGGRLSACGTTMSSAGSAGRACNNLEALIVPLRRGKLRRIKHFSSTNPHDFTNRVDHHWIGSIRRRSSTRQLLILTSTASVRNRTT